MLFQHLLALAVFLAPQAANASAVYAWIPNDPASCCRGVLELSDAAYAAGGVSWQPGAPLDSASVERFHFEGRFKTGPLHPTALAGDEIEISIAFAASPPSALCCAWNFELRVAGEGLTGRFRVTTQNDDVIMSARDGVWELERAGTDAVPSGVVCGQGAPRPCLRSRGKWVLISAPSALRKTTFTSAAFDTRKNTP